MSVLKLHNAMWPGLVGKGDDEGQEPPISLERMLDLTAAAEAQTEPVEVTGPRLSVNAICLFGRLQIRVIDDVSVPEGYDFADCNALERRDVTDCPITWGDGHKDLSPFVGKKIRLHIQADNATSLFSYRFGQVVS